MKEYIQIVTSVETKNDSEAIADKLLSMHLAACIQIVGPVTSRYWWQGKIETASEYQCIIKSRRDLFNKIEKIITEIHPYDVPEILAFPVCEGNKPYLTWMDEELKQQ